MQRRKEFRERLGGIVAGDRRAIGRLTLDPARDRPGVLEQFRRFAETTGYLRLATNTSNPSRMRWRPKSKWSKEESKADSESEAMTG
ncbi:hypothetical protein FB390_4829 [Nocardia bhagyanarayanae]|uniref:Uncharacterized protein n=1 Tax=Nocardia bhagyanarayanae TaxID=1215925 RepID=A0A543FGZ1_9NOCA|nr:hypothetical protein FB390_4829 [Nocardia bhagyanarayanae]